MLTDYKTFLTEYIGRKIRCETCVKVPSHIYYENNMFY